VLQPNSATPVVVVNQPPPATDPFMALLTKAFFERKVWLEYFAWSVNWNTIAASASNIPKTITIDPSIDFLLLQLQLVGLASAGNVSSPDMSIEIQEASGRHVYSDGPIHTHLICGKNRGSAGIGGVPGNLPSPRYIRGNNAVTAKLTNHEATPYIVYLAYVGIRITYLDTSREALFNVPY